MIRNEADILPAFLPHIAALFDHVLIIDHLCHDGSRQMIDTARKDQTRWLLWSALDPGYFQEAYSAFAMRHLFQETDCDAVVFLDADEFVNVQTRAMFDTIVGSCCEQGFVGEMPWINCLPAGDLPVVLGCSHWRAQGKPRGSKVIIPRSLFERQPTIRPGLGNHVANIGERAAEARSVGRLLHFPLRSVAQMKQKMVLGSLALFARGDDLPNTRHHWLEAMRRLADDGLDEADMLGMAASYSERDAAYFRLPRAEIPYCGYMQATLAVANTPIEGLKGLCPPDPLRLVADQIAGWRPWDRHFVHPRDAHVTLSGAQLMVSHRG